MDEKLDEFKNYVNQKLITLKRKDETTSVAPHMVKNSFENDQLEKINPRLKA